MVRCGIAEGRMRAVGHAIGLYGGTFDPVHLGHLAVANAALSQLNLLSLVFIPARDPPLRAPPGASAADRVAMLRLAVDGQAGFAVDTRELARAGPSYTFDTLCGLRAAHGTDQPLAWLIGADAFARFDEWHRWRELTGLAHFIVVARPGAPAERDWSKRLRDFVAARRVTSAAALHGQAAGGILHFVGPRMAISATAVRARCAAQLPATDLLTAEVSAYITQRHLYGWC